MWTDDNHDWPIHFQTIADIQKFVNHVTRSKFWKQAGGRPFVLAKQGRNTNAARGWTDCVEIPPWGFSKPVILHELAHSLSYRVNMHEPDHGGLFVLIFRRLIERELGIEERRRFDRVAECGNVSLSPANSALVSRIPT